MGYKLNPRHLISLKIKKIAFFCIDFTGFQHKQIAQKEKKTIAPFQRILKNVFGFSDFF